MYYRLADSFFFRLTEDAFNALRLIVTIAVMCWKVMLMPSYMQAYLNMAVYRIEEQKKEAGRITNVDLQKKVTIIFIQFVDSWILCCRWELYFTISVSCLCNTWHL